MRISDWSSDVCSSDLALEVLSHAGEGLLHLGLGDRDLVAARFLNLELFVDEVTQNLHAQALAFRRIDLSAIGGQNKVEPVFDIGVGDDLHVHDSGRLAHARIGRTQYGQIGWQVEIAFRRSEEHKSEIQTIMRKAYTV